MEKITREELLKAKIPGEETGIQVKTGFCGFCGGDCLLDFYIKDGKIIKTEGNCTLPGANGRVCVKGAAIKQALYNPERILYPMKRVGKRGEGKFERISWKEALDTIAEKMQSVKETYGPEQTMVYVGHPKWFRPQITEFVNKYGTPNYGTESSTCAYALMMANQCNFGQNIMLMPPDFGRCRTLVVWGVNPLYSNSVKGGAGFLHAVDRGAKVIVVDPKCTPTTEYAQLHLRPIPGTDGALALGMARVIITENLHDCEYIKKYTYGYEEYRDYVMDFTPEKVEEITGVPKSDMIRTARMIAAEGPTSIMLSASPVVHNINGVQNGRAIGLLMALTGNFGIPGGFAGPGSARAMLKDSFMGTKKDREHPEKGVNYGEFPAWDKLTSRELQVEHIADFLLGNGKYPIRNLISFGMNHHMWPRPDRIEEGMKQVEFFSCADLYMNDTCKYADILLPAAVTQEREQVELLGPQMVYYQPKVVKNQGETKNDMEILLELAKRLGFTLGNPTYRTYEEYLEDRLSPTGLTLDELKEHGMMPAKHIMPARTTEDIMKVQTPTGKIEFVSTILNVCKKEWHEGVPAYHDFRETLPMKEYPLILSTGSRKPQLFHSRTYRLPWLVNLEDCPIVELHPEDAENYSVKTGEMVTLETPVGQMDMEAVVNSSCLQGAVNVYHGAGNYDINLLIDDQYIDPISGFPGFKSYCCRIVKKGA